MKYRNENNFILKYQYFNILFSIFIYFDKLQKNEIN